MFANLSGVFTDPVPTYLLPIAPAFTSSHVMVAVSRCTRARDCSYTQELVLHHGMYVHVTDLLWYIEMDVLQSFPNLLSCRAYNAYKLSAEQVSAVLRIGRLTFFR